MNIQNEIEKFHKLGYETLQKQLVLEQEELRVKQYLFKVLHVVKELDMFIKTGIFEKQGIVYINFTQAYDYDIGEVLSNIEILNENKEQMNKYSKGQYTPAYDVIDELLSFRYLTLENGLYNQDIQVQNITLELNEHAKENLTNYLLNSELRKACSYIQLLEKMPEKKDTISNKKKI